jgi:molybdopterin-binding protein
VSEAELDRLAARHQPEAKRRPIAADVDDTLAGLSARNRLHGFVEEVRVDGLLAQVRLRVGDQLLTAVITADAVRALKLRRGDDAVAVVKSTEVMIARSAVPAPKRPRARRP